MAKEEKKETGETVQEEMNSRSKKLYRSETNRGIGGVAGGLGEYLGIDATVIRLFFLLAAIFNGLGLIIYLIMWLTIPSESKIKEQSEDILRENVEEIRTKAKGLGGEVRIHRSSDGRWIWGVFLLALGVLFLFHNFGLWAWFDFGRLWPLFLILIGVSILVRK